MRGIAALLRPMGRLAAMLQQAQGARTLAGGGPEGLEDTKVRLGLGWGGRQGQRSAEAGPTGT